VGLDEVLAATFSRIAPHLTERVNVHDFPDPKLGKAIPYGVYDLGRNTGWVSVGTDHDTAAFAAATLRRWWEQVGQRTYPAADRLLVTTDAGGSNGYRVRAWKLELAKLAQETGLQITVCHLPPGTSKWNRIEHRLVSAISMNWRGRPLESHEVIVELIGATTTHTGLSVPGEQRSVSPACCPATASSVQVAQGQHSDRSSGTVTASDEVQPASQPSQASRQTPRFGLLIDRRSFYPGVWSRRTSS
jgi:hypothetical protein